MVKHYVEFFFTGAFFNDRQILEIKNRDPKQIMIPSSAFAYRFFDRTESVIKGEKLIGEKTNISPYTFFGKAYTLKEVKANFPKLKTLIKNMESNGIKKAVYTNQGTWQALNNDDIVIS